MGKKLNRFNKLAEIAIKLTNLLIVMTKIAEEDCDKHPKLLDFSENFIETNKLFLTYLKKNYPKVIISDEIDQKFNNIMKQFGKKK